MTSTTYRERPEWLTNLGREIYGPTPPGGASPWARDSALDPDELAEVVELIASARIGHDALTIPERLRIRDWTSVIRVVLALDEQIGREGCGWKIGAAAEDINTFLDDVELQAGDILFQMLNTANRDPLYFNDPDAFPTGGLR